MSGKNCTKIKERIAELEKELNATGMNRARVEGDYKKQVEKYEAAKAFIELEPFAYDVANFVLFQAQQQIEQLRQEGKYFNENDDSHFWQDYEGYRPEFSEICSIQIGNILLPRKSEASVLKVKFNFNEIHVEIFHSYKIKNEIIKCRNSYNSEYETAVGVYKQIKINPTVYKNFITSLRNAKTISEIENGTSDKDETERS